MALWVLEDVGGHQVRALECEAQRLKAHRVRGLWLHPTSPPAPEAYVVRPPLISLQ